MHGIEIHGAESAHRRHSYSYSKNADLDVQTLAFYWYLPAVPMGMEYTSGLARPSRTWWWCQIWSRSTGSGVIAFLQNRGFVHIYSYDDENKHNLDLSNVYSITIVIYPYDNENVVIVIKKT